MYSMKRKIITAVTLIESNYRFRLCGILKDLIRMACTIMLFPVHQFFFQQMLYLIFWPLKYMLMFYWQLNVDV